MGTVAPLGQVQIHNRNGAIHLTVPLGASFQLQATARNGNIEAKLNLPVNSAGEGQSMAGQVGTGGPRVELVADHGDIDISRDGCPRRSAHAASPPLPPAPGAKSHAPLPSLQGR